MRPDYIAFLIFALFGIGIFFSIIAYIQERKRDALRRERALLKGWNYESSYLTIKGSTLSSTVTFKVEGSYGSHLWKLEQRKGKDNNRPLIFTSKSIALQNDVFYFADKRETDILLKPFMQYVLKFGSAIAPKDSNLQRTETITMLQNAKPLDIQSGSGKWNYGVLATSSEFGYKVLSQGFQAEIDSLSLIDISTIPPSVILSPDGLEIKWQARKIDAEKMETIIDSSLRLMSIFDRALKNN